MKKQINYLDLYTKSYKNIPNGVFWGTLLVFGLAALSGAVLCFAAGEDELIGIGVLCLMFGLPLAWLLAHLNGTWTAIMMSQKIVATDALLAMQNGTDVASAAIEPDELPEL